MVNGSVFRILLSDDVYDIRAQMAFCWSRMEKVLEVRATLQNVINKYILGKYEESFRSIYLLMNGNDQQRLEKWHW